MLWRREKGERRGKEREREGEEEREGGERNEYVKGKEKSHTAVVAQYSLTHNPYRQ